jgi:hypothetical protein
MFKIVNENSNKIALNVVTARLSKLLTVIEVKCSSLAVGSFESSKWGEAPLELFLKSVTRRFVSKTNSGYSKFG